MSSADDLLFLSNQFTDVGEWLFDGLETCGEYTIQNSNSNMYMDGRSPSELDEVGKVMVRSWDGSIDLPSQLVWEVEQVFYPNLDDTSYYSIRSKSSGGYLDGRNLAMKLDPDQPLPSYYQWYIAPTPHNQFASSNNIMSLQVSK
jgi:hypothetical protein